MTQSATPTSAKPRILLAMVTVGNGHKAPADALEHGLEHLYRERFDIDVLDFTLATGDAAFDKQHKSSWDLMLKYPKTAYWGQRFIDTLPPPSWVRFVTGRMVAQHAQNAAEFVKKNNYDLMVATHFFTLQALAIAKTQHGVTIPLVGINTDPFDAHVMWAENHADEMICSSEQAKAKLVKNGVSEKKISVFGYPLGLAFLDDSLSQAEARAQLGLKPDKLTVLQSAGGEGIGGQLEGFVTAALKADLDLQYVVACGRNEKLYAHLQMLAAKHTGRLELLPQGFITNMQDWIVASDLVLGKAGAATTFEALALKRPIFHTSYAAYNERTNIDFCVEAGIGRYVKTPAELVEVLKPLVDDRSELEALSAKIEALNIEAGTLSIARHLVETYLG